MLLPAPRGILLIQIRYLGDVVLSTALLEDLHCAFPHAAIDFLVGDAAAPLLLEHPLIRERIVLDVDHPVAMWRRVRARHYDWVIDVQGNLRTAMLTRISGAQVRVGWRVRAWPLAYTHALPRGGGPEYVVRERRRLLGLVGVPATSAGPRLYLSAEERERGEHDAIAAGASPAAPRVGILLSTREPAKNWRVEGFAELATALASEGVTPLVFQTPGDEWRVQRLRQLAPSAAVVPPLDVRRFVGVLAACHVFVSGDTGPAHMADALAVPRVTIFGPTSPVSWAPAHPNAIAVRDELAPTVRLRHRARLAAAGHDLTAGVSPAMVEAAVWKLLNSK
jgi:ADP-heptose:LPS heptosyltransferase